ncbi:MAG: META domain-containing protein [Halobacteriota archaeon]
MVKPALIVLASIVIVAVLTAGCINSTTPSPSPSPTASGTSAALEGTTWSLTSLATEGTATDVLPNTTVTISFDNGNVTGSSGCNRYFAHYELSDQNITFTSIFGATLMYCTDPGVMTQETTYMQLLLNATAYVISEDTLSLVNADGQDQLIFTAVNGTA